MQYFISFALVIWVVLDGTNNWCILLLIYEAGMALPLLMYEAEFIWDGPSYINTFKISLLLALETHLDEVENEMYFIFNCPFYYIWVKLFLKVYAGHFQSVWYDIDTIWYRYSICLHLIHFTVFVKCLFSTYESTVCMFFCKFITDIMCSTHIYSTM